MTQMTIGGFEWVGLPQLKIDQVLAKVDTGAYSGAVHCSSIKVVERDGVKELHFIPTGGHNQLMKTTSFTTSRVRSSTGHLVRRYLIETEILLRQRMFPITIGLSDRSDMKHEVLIGRRFLREHGLLVDVQLNQEYDTDGR